MAIYLLSFAGGTGVRSNEPISCSALDDCFAEIADMLTIHFARKGWRGGKRSIKSAGAARRVSIEPRLPTFIEEGKAITSPESDSGVLVL
jgi:hypothetical protein